jgi:hypothetical protein
VSDDRDAVDELVRDAADAQRSRGQLPRVGPMRDYFVATCEALDRQQALARPAPAPSAPAPRAPLDPVRIESEYRRRCRRAGIDPTPGKWSVERRTGPEPIPTGPVVSGLGTERLRARIRLLRGLPEWSDKLKRINPLALSGQLGEEKRRHATELVRQIVEASDRVFGPWWKDPPRRLFSI